MADNVAVTAGSGTTLATDDCAGVHYQVVKIADGTADATGVLKVLAEDAASASGHTGIGAMVVQSATPADTAADLDYSFLQMSGGKLWTIATQKFVTVSGTEIVRPSDTTAYAVNDCMSDSTSAPTSGGFTITGASRASGGSGIIVDCVVCTDADAATPLQGEIILFNTSVTNVNDNSAFAISDAEAKTLVGKIPFFLEDLGNNGVYHAAGVNLPFTCSGSANLRFLVRVRNAYTPASGEKVNFLFKILQVD